MYHCLYYCVFIRVYISYCLVIVNIVSSCIMSVLLLFISFSVFIVLCNHSLESSEPVDPCHAHIFILLKHIKMCLMSQALRLPIGAFGSNLNSNLALTSQ